MAATDKYGDFVTHPRYGQRPRITGLNPETDYATGKVFLHWHSPKEDRIPNTAIPADLPRQSPATVPVTHYFDVRRQCRDCERPFLFFAEEQKYWYEDLGFPLESDCVRCVDCRRKQHGLERKRERYAELLHASDRTSAQDLELAECCLSLVEGAGFHKRQLQRVRMILKKLRPQMTQSAGHRAEDLWKRVLALESKNDG
jgi:Probable zinc-ribbon domain